MTTCRILYASETGTAEDVAYGIFRQFSFLPKTTFTCMDDFDITNLPNSDLVICIVSTAGDGEVPSNMKKFWKFLLQKSLPVNSLELVRFAVFGLGDSSYEKFNAAGRKLSVRLKQLGAKEMIPIGLGDDQDRYGFLTALEPWKKELTEEFLMWTGIAVGLCRPIENSYKVELLPAKPSESFETLSRFGPDESVTVAPLSIGTVHENSRITSSAWSQDVRHIKIGFESVHPETYRAGDVAYIYPENNSRDVLRALAILQRSAPTLQLNNWVLVANYSASNRKRQIGNVACSVDSLLRKCIDIHGVPQRSFFEALSSFSKIDEEREKLSEIASAEGTDLYYEYCLREKRTYIEVFEDFRGVSISLDVFLELVPRLQPRQYSIASSGVTSEVSMELCVALVTYTTKLRRNKVGICSEYLSHIKAGDSICYAIRKGSLHIPEGKPILLVGPGTGVAPMRAVIQERLAFSTTSEQRSLKTLLFFGSRKKDSDFLYCDEWQTSLEVQVMIDGESDHAYDESKPVAIVTAFSRDQESKVYVYHKMKEHGALVWRFLSEGCTIFIAGSAKKMPQDVKRSLLDVIKSFGGLNDVDSKKYFENLIKDKRYFVEAWS